MRIFVIEPNVFTGDDLAPGEMYEVKPCENGTERQNRTWHLLLQEYWSSGCHSYNAKNFLHFRQLIKLCLGAGAEAYQSLLDETGEYLDKPVVRYRVKSWGKYSKQERTSAIQNLISEMQQAGVQTKRFYEILEGMAA